MKFDRTAHGTGASALVRIETPPLDEIPPPNATRTGAALASREAAGRPFTPGNKAAQGRRPKLARLGVDVPDGTDPRYLACLKQAKRYVTHRVRELAVENGGKLGAGPSAMLASSGLALAASRYLYSRAAESSDPAVFRQAAALADSARQQELTAVALAERERAASVEPDDDRVRRERLETARAGK